MNTTLPPSRDLPPGRHAEIRAAVLAEVSARPARRGLAPFAAAVAALAVVGLVAWFAPWRSEVAKGGPPGPSVAEEGMTGVLRKCLGGAGLGGEFVLRQSLTDEAGSLAVLDNGEQQLICVGDTSGTGYASRRAALRPLTGPVSIDAVSGVSGEGDWGRNASVVGRVSPEVAKVTFVLDGKAVTAVLGRGTYLVRMLDPSDEGLENLRTGVVRAYDKNGTLLAEVGS